MAFDLGSGRKLWPEVRTWRSGFGMEVDPIEDLDLDEYRRLVVEAEEAVKSPAAAEVPAASEVVMVDLRGLDLDAEEEEEEEAAPMGEEEDEMHKSNKRSPGSIWSRRRGRSNYCDASRCSLFALLPMLISWVFILSEYSS